MNDVLGLINVEILAEEDRPESWKVKDGYSLFRYYDGIVSSSLPSLTSPMSGSLPRLSKEKAIPQRTERSP